MAFRYSLQDVQYSKLFNIQTPKIVNRYCKIQNEFDDRKVSQSPASFVSDKKPIISFKMDHQMDYNSRKQRIKSKIKSQVRQKIRVIFDRQVKSQLNERKSQDSSSLLQKPKVLIKINQSEVMNMPLCSRTQKIQFKKGDFIIPMKLHEKDLSKRQCVVRNRIINSVLQRRRQQNYKRFYHYPSKRSSPIIQMSEKYEEKLQPWRFNQDNLMQEPFQKKIHFK